jgi:hypothetical protein
MPSRNIQEWFQECLTDRFDNLDEEEKVDFMNNLNEERLQELLDMDLEIEGLESDSNLLFAIHFTIDWEKLVKDVREEIEDNWCEFIANKINKENGY